MKRSALIAFSCLLLSTVAVAQEDGVSVSVIELIATPEKFDGKLVSVIGFLVMGERASLSVHREDAEHVLGNGILVVPSEEMRRHKEELNGMYVVVVGVFRAVPGVGGRPVRVIKDIKACTVWSDPARPRSDYPYGKRPLQPKQK